MASYRINPSPYTSSRTKRIKMTPIMIPTVSLKIIPKVREKLRSEGLP